MQTYGSQEIACIYARGGVALSGAEQTEVEGRLEDAILSVITHPPEGRFIAVTPAVILKNSGTLNFDYLIENASKNPALSAKLGYLLDVATACVDAIQSPERYHASIKRLPEAARLRPSPQRIVFISNGAKIFFNDSDLLPRDEQQKRWNVGTRCELEEFKRHSRLAHLKGLSASLARLPALGAGDPGSNEHKML